MNEIPHKKRSKIVKLLFVLGFIAVYLFIAVIFHLWPFEDHTPIQPDTYTLAQ
jgi:hypothetical protein